MAANRYSPPRSSMASSRPNPIARKSESKDPLRRSFSGNPFAKPSSIIANSRGGFNPNTPVNSPSDFPTRSSFGKENSSSLRDYEDKENGKSSNFRSGRVPSPASATKGTKSFMSPTISAVSKFTTSPRKKILVEKNEPFRSSVLFPESKGQVMEDNHVKPAICSNKKKTVSFADAINLATEDDDLSKPEICLKEKKVDAPHDSTVTDMDHTEDVNCLKEKKVDAANDSTVIDVGHEEALKFDSNLDSVVPVNLNNDTDSPWENVAGKVCVNLDPTFNISPRASCSTSSPMLAPLDADPSMPPYDPKTNYLSPRPQFLHYKPNPRIELMHNQDGKRLDESFISENLSDSEVSETLSEETQKESGDVSSDETVKEKEEDGEEEEEEEEEEEITVPSHKPKEMVQSKVGSKSKFFAESKFIALLVALVLAFMAISVSDSTVTNLSVLKDLSLYDLYVPPEIPELAKVKFERLVRKSRLWAADSFSYIYELMSELRGVYKLGHLRYSNLSAFLEENHLADGYPKFTGAEFDNKMNLMASIGERHVKTEQLEESHQETAENEEDTEEVSEEDNSTGFEEDNSAGSEEQVHQDTEADNNIDKVLEDRTEPESEEVCLTPLAEVIKPADVEAELTKGTVHFDVNNDIKLQGNIDLTDQSVEISEVTETQPEVHEAKESEVESDNFAEIEFTKAAENTENIVELDSTSEDNSIPAAVDKFLTRNVVGISSLVLLLSLLAGSILLFNHAKKGKLSTPNVTTPVSEYVMTKKLDYIPISVTAEREQKLASSNWQAEVDMSGDSASSEMSSFKSSSQSKKGLETSSAAYSQERKPRKNYRRESLASSDFSLSSASYGSFTTYEKITSKHVYGDEEVITPVRRSSRIKNLVTSP